MKKFYFSAILVFASFLADAQCHPNVCLIDYGYHNDSSPNADMTAIKAALPDILIDNTPGGYWAGGCMASQYTPLGIHVYSYITSGYEGTEYNTTEDNLAANITRIDAIAADGATGVFLDEVWNLIGSPPYGGTLASHKAYITSIYNECQAKGLKLILNAGVSDFDAWLMSNGDYLMSDEAYSGTRVPTASESPFASRLLVVAYGINTAANAAAITTGAWSNGFGHSYACVSYTSLPSWLANYISLITPVSLPAAPSVGTITQPTCNVVTGSIILNSLPAAGTWTLTQTPGGTTAAGTGTSSTITGLATGTYTYTVTNASGCISSVSANVVINPAPAPPAAPIITLIGNVLHSDAANGNQWYKQGVGLITGEINQTYLPTANGSYYVIVTLSGCSSDTSNIINVVFTGIEPAENNKTINVYPNPADDIITLNINNANNEEVKLNIYTVMGLLVKSEMLRQNQQQINLRDLCCGIYLLEIKSKRWPEKQKLIIQR